MFKKLMVNSQKPYIFWGLEFIFHRTWGGGQVIDVSNQDKLMFSIIKERGCAYNAYTCCQFCLWGIHLYRFLHEVGNSLVVIF